jgi:hypothetical protein
MHQLIAVGIIVWCVLCVVMAYSACILASRADGDE